MDVLRRSPSPLSGYHFSRPLCAQVYGVVVVDVPVLVHTADDGMKMGYAAVGFLMQPYRRFAARYVRPCGNYLAVLVADFLHVESGGEVLPQLPPILQSEVFGILHRRAYLHADDIVLDIRMVHRGKLHFRKNTCRIHTLRHEVVADTGNPFWMLLVP